MFWHWQWLGTNFFGELEELEETETVTLVIIWEVTGSEGVVPTVLVQRTVLNRTYRVFPLVAGGKVGAFHDAAARETEDARLELLE